MTERDLPRPAGDVVEDGIPATEEVRDEILQTGDIGVADMPMPDRPLGADQWGITELEERMADSLDRRLAREVPDVPGHGDDDDLGGRYDTPSAEEAAMHIVDEDNL